MTTPDATTVAGFAVGTTGVTFPLWNDFVAWATGANQLLIAAGGFVVLVLTIRKLWIENKVAARRLRDLEASDARHRSGASE